MSTTMAMLDTDLIGSLLAAAGPKMPGLHRDNQLCALVGLGRDMRIRYVHYCRSISDFPAVGAILKGSKG